MDKCTCFEKDRRHCDTDARINQAFSFVKMDQLGLTNDVREVLCALCAPKSVTNEAFTGYEQKQRKRCKLDTTKNGTTVYWLFGKHLWQRAFCDVVQLMIATINRMALDVVRDGLQEKLPHLWKYHYESCLFRLSFAFNFCEALATDMDQPVHWEEDPVMANR